MIPLHDAIMLGLGAILTLAISFLAAVWLLHGTTLPDTRRSDGPGD